MRLNDIEACNHSGGDWREVFEQAVALHPRYRPLYERTMEFAHEHWGGTDADRAWVEQLAIKNNPGATWPHTLRGRKLPPGSRPVI